MKGLEPPRLSAPDPKSGAATNYATSALRNIQSGCKYTNFACCYILDFIMKISVEKPVLLLHIEPFRNMLIK